MYTQTYNVPYLSPSILASSMTPLTVQVPGSKSITNRALLLATLADGTSILRGTLFSDDSRYFLQCIRDLGFAAADDETARTITVTGLGGRIPCEEASLYVGSAGTAARFLTALLGISKGVWHMDASQQMRRRPMAPLLASLRELGCEITYEEAEGFFPFTLQGQGFERNDISVDIGHSSQFLSALLIAACLSRDTAGISVTGTHGMSYIDMTLHMMRQFGVNVQKDGSLFTIPCDQQYHKLDYQVEPDVSAACYFYALAPLLGTTVTVSHVHPDSMQGDIHFLDLLAQMGCTMTDTPEGICLTGPPGGSFPGITADMSACSDQAITLAAIAPFAKSPTTITGIGHIRYQESDRLTAMATELARMGITCEAGSDSITIYPGIPHPCEVETYDDHRMAMGFALTGLRASGITIRDPGCCRKTFEDYFTVLDGVIAKFS